MKHKNHSKSKITQKWPNTRQSSTLISKIKQTQNKSAFLPSVGLQVFDRKEKVATHFQVIILKL